MSKAERYIDTGITKDGGYYATYVDKLSRFNTMTSWGKTAGEAQAKLMETICAIREKEIATRVTLSAHRGGKNAVMIMQMVNDAMVYGLTGVFFTPDGNDVVIMPHEIYKGLLNKK